MLVRFVALVGLLILVLLTGGCFGRSDSAQSVETLEADVAIPSAGATPSSSLLEAVDPAAVAQVPSGANRTVERVQNPDFDVYRAARGRPVSLRIGQYGLGVEARNRTPTPRSQ